MVLVHDYLIVVGRCHFSDGPLLVNNYLYIKETVTTHLS